MVAPVTAVFMRISSKIAGFGQMTVEPVTPVICEYKLGSIYLYAIFAPLVRKFLTAPCAIFFCIIAVISLLDIIMPLGILCVVFCVFFAI